MDKITIMQTMVQLVILMTIRVHLTLNILQAEEEVLMQLPILKIYIAEIMVIMND